MTLKTKLAAALVLAASASMAQATTYNVTGVFTENMVNTMFNPAQEQVFNGSFDWDGTTLTNLSGTMNSSMYYAPGNPNLTLNQNLITSVSGSIVTASIFLFNGTNVYSDGGYDARSAANGTTSGTGNAYFTFSFDTTGGGVTATGVDTTMEYGDCTQYGMMMQTCMTAFGPQTGTFMGVATGAGSMMGFSKSLSITQAQVAAVPVPAAAWLFGGALISLFGANRRKSVLPA